MSIYRVSDTCVFADDFLYHFESEEEASGFDECLNNNSLAFCKIRFKAERSHRAPVKVQSQIDFLESAKENRREDATKRQKDKREALLRKKRGLPPMGPPPLQPQAEVIVRPYEGKHVSYVVHGHAGYLPRLGDTQYKQTRMKFYCDKGEATEQTEHRNANNAPSKLINSLLGSKADDNRLYQTVEPGTACEVLLVQAEANPEIWPNQGIWFVARDNAGSAPYECRKIADLPAQMTLFPSILKDIIFQDARVRRLRAPLDIYWVACRAMLVSN